VNVVISVNVDGCTLASAVVMVGVSVSSVDSMSGVAAVLVIAMVVLC